MIRAGLTGSIGMGKSTTADLFREEGVPVYDADAAVHELYRGEPVPLIAKAFPGTTENGVVNRQKLGERVLGRADELKKLESLIHPLVHAKERAFLDKCEKDNVPLVLLDIPLLFETGGESRVDVIIVVTADAREQRRRVLARPEMTKEKFENILARQLPDSEKRRRANYIIDTNHGIESAKVQVKEIISAIVGA